MDWLKASDADVVCLQEIKSEENQLDLDAFRAIGYEPYLFSAEKKGYSGVGLLSRIAPDRVVKGMNIDRYDSEGRCIQADFGDVSVMSVYMPSGSSGDLRQDFKMVWLQDFQHYINELKKTRPKLIIAGDYNICHRAIDIHNPISNAKSSGFLPEERAWMEQFVQSGFTDSFRHLNKEPHHYTWWSYRANARAKNLGWRIDYIMLTENLTPHLERCVILPEARHSDHCPVLASLKF
jgi:exodeoxyribonuclease-3